MLIVFEGIDGTGKGTQIRKLLLFLRQNKVKVKLHKYPTKKAGEAFAHLGGKKTISPLKLAGIFASDIANEREKIASEVAHGFVVICDRYIHSTLAYQGAMQNYGKVQKLLEKYEVNVPDLVILMDVDTALSARRKKAQKELDRFEKNLLFLKKVRANYLRMASEEFCAYKYSVVDASRPADEVFTDVITIAEPMVIKKMER